ncbi:protein THEM6-like isoform X2 [Maniola jurtina]|uniref:protein THEM6-like isoform X2 n=1 Tax=Maniola jurtina TaxID=191418 RepID=UPI001E68A37E|nr:protein THEM6-like isoform X2 [Maniola jurtina]
MYCVIVSAVALLYIFWDVNYYIRMFFTVLIGRLFQKKSSLKDTTSIYGFCTTQDVDLLFNHLNNARYVREADFARIHFYVRTRLFNYIKAVGGHVLQGATNIRYRRIIPIFTAYKIETRLVYWDDKALFIEQKFVTFDGFVRAIVLSRQNLVNVDVESLLKNIPGVEVKPDCSQEIKYWLQAIEASSVRLRNKD